MPGDRDVVGIERLGGAPSTVPGWLRQQRAHRDEAPAAAAGCGVGVWASDFDADGRCQAFCFPVKGVREILALKRSLEERHQHLLGKQMESGSGVRRPRAARREGRRGGGGGRQAGAGVLLNCCGGMEDLLPLTPCQRVGSLLDPKSHRCESRVCPLGSPR